MHLKKFRWTVGAWMLYCLVIGASYSSNLKSHLTTPELVPALDSLEEIVSGDLPWKYPVYYTAEEEIMASMKDPVHQKFWKDKITLQEYSTPVRNKLYNLQ